MRRDHAVILAKLSGFFGDFLLDADQAGRLTTQAELSELGVLDSLGVAHLIVFIREEFGVEIPARDLTVRKFASLEAIADLIVSLSTPAECRDTDARDDRDLPRRS